MSTTAPPVLPESDGEATPQEPITFAEMFAGIGGFRVGLEKLGMKCVWACEVEGQARATYRENFPDSDGCRLHGDIQVSAATVPAHDMLVGGFPCQPFTRLGKQAGFEHRHGRLFEHILKILKSRQPPMFLLENVPGLLTSPGGAATLDEIVLSLSSCGYHVSWKIIDSSRLLPQLRKRIYIVGFSKKCGVEDSDFSFPSLPSLGRGVSDILCRVDNQDNSKDKSIRRVESTIAACSLSKAQWEKRLALGAPESMFYVKPHLPAPTLTKSYRKAPGKRSGRKFAHQALQKAAKVQKTAEDVNPQGKTRQPFLIGWCNLIPPSFGNGGDSMEDNQCRRPRFYAPRECARLQGFPNSFKIVREFEDPNGPHASLFGNAVSPPIIAAVAGAMLQCLSQAQYKVYKGSDASMPGSGAKVLSPKFRCARLKLMNGVDIALDMLLEAVPQRTLPMLHERIQSIQQTRSVPSCFDGRTNDLSDQAEDEEIVSEYSSQKPVCFRWRDTGLCQYGNACRFLHNTKAGKSGS